MIDPLTIGQRAFLALGELPLEQQNARQRQLNALKQYNVAESEALGQSRDIVARRYGISGKSVTVARGLKQTAPDLAEEVIAGTISLNRANKAYQLRMLGVRPEKVNCVALALYRAFSEDDILLYIGKTDDLKSRISNHTATSRWWIEFSYLTVERRFRTRDELHLAEREAILAERPLYNVDGKS